MVSDMTEEIKNKQIEEMANVVRDTIYRENENGFAEGFDALCTATEYVTEKITEALYNANYRRRSDNTIDLPCKIGDTVWYISKRENEEDFNVHQAVARCIDIRSYGEYVILHWESEDLELHKVVVRFSDFGISAFLVKEEADKVLAKRKGGE